nr:sigma-70 family RNA polymerase sigma factor [Bacteroides pyogenes]
MKEMLSIEEKALVAQLKRGNCLAFTVIYKKYARQAYILSFKYLCNKTLAEDAVQNLFMKLWLKREDLQEDIPINHLLFTMLKNDLLNILRDSKTNIFVLEDCLEMLNYIDGGDVEEQELEQEQLELIKHVVDKLSPQRKKIFFMKISGKYSNQEIADVLGLSVNTIKFQYSQSLKQIKFWIREAATLCLLLL